MNVFDCIVLGRDKGDKVQQWKTRVQKTAVVQLSKERGFH